MNRICKTLLAATLLTGALQAKAQGLEGIIVEDYYTISAADADYLNNTAGVTYPISVGTKVYRIYVDMAPGYKLNTVNGSPAVGGTSPNPLDFTTTTTFWNEDGFGSEVPPQTARFDDGAAFDSYITIGLSGRSGGAVGCGANTQQQGILKTADTNGNLTLCSVYSGFPAGAGTPDGNAPPAAAIPALTYNLGGLIDFTALQADGNQLIVVGDAWATLPNGTGADPNGTNRQLIAQLTTDGDLSFHINVQLQQPTGGALETYVWNQAAAGEVVSPFLTYPLAGTPDCLGVIGGPALPGTSCNDNNACTINDLWDANCNCAGTFQDTDGDGICNADDDCPNVAGEIGSTCDDGNACTINDALNASCQCVGTFQDTDGDGICNADDDCPNVAGEIGSTCNDNNACTINDVLGANCQCAGTAVDPNDNNPCTLDSCDPVTGVSNVFQDADGDGTCDANDQCPGGPEPGTACDDNNAATTGDVIGVNCVCAGVLGCTPGAPCNDFNACTTGEVFDANCNCGGGTAVDPNDNNPCTLDSCDPVTGVSNVFQDADGDGTCDANDVCPGGPEPGTACNDGNAATTGDVIQANCVCAGVLGCTPGTPCNDFNACTTDEVFDANCNCGGGTAVDPNDNNPCTLDSCDPVTGVSNVFQDADGDGTCDANDVCPGGPEPGTQCDDGNPNTSGDVVGLNCQCSGTFANDCNGVPGGPAQPGTACDDNDATTGSDTWSANCVCIGLPIDCEGVPGGSALPGTTCSDNNACTINDVYDANCTCTGTIQDTDGDGVCNANDNCPNVVGQIGSPCDDLNANTTGDALNANCHCVGTPVGGCTENLTLSINLDGNPGETTWALYNEAETTVILSGGPFASNQANTTVTENICVNVGCYHLRVSDSGNNGITGGGYVLRDAASRRIIDASVGSFTSVSEINTGVSPNRSFCVPVSNVSMLSNSCDRTNILITSPIYCNSQPGASGYQFWIYDAHGSYNRRVLKTTNSLVPASLITSPVPANLDLNVRVRPLVGGNYLPFGPACRIRFRPNPPATAGRDMDFSEVNAPVMTIFPNPNRDGQLTVSMEGLNVEEATIVDVDIYDMLGKRVVAERATAADGQLNHRMDLAGLLGTGLYMVNVTIDGQLYTQRLVMQ